MNKLPPSEQNAAVDPEADPASSSLYEVYGRTLSSDFDFTFPLPSSDGPDTLGFTCRSSSPDPHFWDHASPVYTTRNRQGDRSGLYRGADAEVLRFLNGSADFYLQPERIACHLRDSSYTYGVEIWLLGTVFAYSMEKQGLPTLHASAVVVEDRAVAFLATSRGGKSSLGAAMMQAGHPLLTDDLLPVDVQEDPPTGRPGYPQMRLWPDQALHFAGGVENLPRVVPHLEKRRVPVGSGRLGTFCHDALPLGCLYLPSRRPADDPNTNIEIEPVSPQDAVIELVRQSFLPNLIAATDMQAARMQRLSRLARRVPIRRLIYPDGVDHLPRVRKAVVNDLRAQ